MMLRGMATPTWMFVSMRSEIYAASIYLLHVRALLWPIIVVQATLTAWVIWLVVRSLCLRPLTVYLVLIALLCALTGVAWYASYVMPDILGSVPYLSLYLLVFVTESLRHWERAALAGVSCWAVTSHSTYLVVTALLCVLFTLLWLGRWVAMRGRGVGLGRMVGVVLLAAAAQMVVHARLYGRPSLFGNPPPFLMARLLGDGPARLYLQQHCSTLPWTICLHANDLPRTEGDFLWTPGGIWQTATLPQRDSLRREEMPLLWDTLRSYPRQQMARSWSNFVELLTTVGPWDFWNYGEFTPRNLDFALPGLSTRYPKTRQARSAMPLQFFRRLQGPVMVISVLTILALLPWLWRSGTPRLPGLVATIVIVVPLNALLCGVISCNDPRLQDRVGWLVVFLAGLMVVNAWTTRTSRIHARIE
jgi:hypothetical protein